MSNPTDTTFQVMPNSDQLEFIQKETNNDKRKKYVLFKETQTTETLFFLHALKVPQLFFKNNNMHGSGIYGCEVPQKVKLFLEEMKVKQLFLFNSLNVNFRTT